MSIRSGVCLAFLVPFLCSMRVIAQVDEPHPAPKQGAALLKTDIMGVFAHPDDETGVAATLAYYALGRTSVIANVYCTRGEGGANMVGTQWGASLGVLREAELRDCLTTLGVRYCYFLDQLDWAYTESVAATLRKWGKEPTLERLVRLVRALRPDIIITMNPAPTPGQHGHHQAAGVLATEAFTAAADPNRFPLQLTKEGLEIWQPRRLFFGGAAGTQTVSTITVSEVLPDGRTPAQVAAKALANHRSQAFGNIGNSPWLQRPQRFTVVKAFVPGTGMETDLLSGLPAKEVMARPVVFTGNAAVTPTGVRFISRPAFTNYERWVAEQGIQHVAVQFRADIPVITGETNVIHLDLAGRDGEEGDLEVIGPEGWRVEPVRQRVRVNGGRASVIVTPPVNASQDGELKAVFTSSAGSKIEAIAKVHPLPRARAVKVAPLKGDGEWRELDRVPAIEILPTQLVQGKVTNAADSSAAFRIAHDGKTLFVEVNVKDDVIVTNIAANDIRGHWRSDSVEICLDPVGGAEDTMGCYKIGIFPFGGTGQVAAARDADAIQGPLEETAPGTRLRSRRTDEGYQILAAIPFTEIGIKPRQTRLGFNLIIYDGDKNNAAPGENINKSRIAWAPRSGVQGRPEDWGRIDLE